MPRTKRRCPWGDDPLMIDYHDREWGTPIHDDALLFEHLTLDCMQAGLSWITILHKREALRGAFDGFDPVKVAAYDSEKVEHLLSDHRIIRNRAKIEAVIHNAQRLLELQSKEGSFDSFIWSFVGGETRHNRRTSFEEVPAFTPESLAMSKALRGKGFKFVGPTICYAFMQAAGLVNDHLVDCFRHEELVSGGKDQPRRANVR